MGAVIIPEPIGIYTGSVVAHYGVRKQMFQSQTLENEMHLRVEQVCRPGSANDCRLFACPSHSVS